MPELLKYLLVASAPGIPEDLKPLSGRWEQADSVFAAMQILKADPDLAAVLIDTPSEIPDIRMLIDFMNSRNNDLLAVPMLIVTDADHIAADEQFLGGSVIDCLQKPVRPAVLKKRVANAQLQVSSVSFSEFAEMLRALPANIYLKDDKGRYVFSSQTWHHLNTDNDPNWTIRGKTDLDIRKDKENAAKAMAADQALLRSGVGSSYIIEEKDGEQEFLQVIKEPLFFPDGRVRGIIGLINVVTEQEQLRRKLREQYITDQLTGLYNRSFYTEYLETMEKDPPDFMSIIVGDCDHLKLVNDTYGHLAGDQYIVSCAKLMKETLPEKALIFRTGGDEFVAFLPDTPETETRSLLDALREGAKKYAVSNCTLSVSLGCSVMKRGDILARCIERADDQMYLDKQARHCSGG